MIFPSNRVRIMVATKPIDFRKGHDSLAAMVKNELHKDPFTGTVFVFRAKKGSEQEEFEIVRLGRTHHERRWMSSAGSCGLSSRRVGFDFLICPTRQRFSQMAVYRDGRWQSGSFSKSKIDGSFSTYRSMRTA